VDKAEATPGSTFPGYWDATTDGCQVGCHAHVTVVLLKNEHVGPNVRLGIDVAVVSTSWKRTTTMFVLIVARALVGPRPVYSESNCTIRFEISVAAERRCSS